MQPFFIPSESMENTLRVGDRVLVDKLSYRFHDIHRGDVVVFNGLDSFTPEVQVDESSNPVVRGLRVGRRGRRRGSTGREGLHQAGDRRPG